MTKTEDTDAYEVTYWFDKEMAHDPADTCNIVTGKHRADKLADVWGENLTKMTGRKVYTKVKKLNED